MYTAYVKGKNGKVGSCSATITEIETSASNAVYSSSIFPVSLGDSKGKISGWTIDYTTLGKNYFLKHNIGSDDKVESQEVCYILDNNLYCLIDDETYFEQNLEILNGSFGEDNCYSSGLGTAASFGCSASDLVVSVSLDSTFISAGDDNQFCNISYGHASCS